MKFRVGPWVYELAIAGKPIRDLAGNELDGRVEESQRKILIGKRVAPAARLDVLLHELRHCWEFHFPLPADREQEANFTAAIVAQAHEDLMAQGGAAALQAMQPGDEIGRDGVTESIPRYSDTPHSDTPPTSRVGAECIGCGGRFTPQFIITERPRIDQVLQGWVVDRKVYCDFCSHLQIWTETATTSGSPSGLVVAAARTVKGEEAERFLEENSAAVCL